MELHVCVPFSRPTFFHLLNLCSDDLLLVSSSRPGSSSVPPRVHVHIHAGLHPLFRSSRHLEVVSNQGPPGGLLGVCSSSVLRSPSSETLLPLGGRLGPLHSRPSQRPEAGSEPGPGKFHFNPTPGTRGGQRRLQVHREVQRWNRPDQDRTLGGATE